MYIAFHLIFLISIVYSELQKYQIQHFDLRSSTPASFRDDEMPGNASKGWIEESQFTAISTPFQNRDDIPIDVQLTVDWMHCRQYHFQYDLQQQLSRKQMTIDERGLMFRETAQQHMICIYKAIRGKISRIQLGRVITLKFHIPLNLWEFNIEPKLKAIVNCPEDEELSDGDKFVVNLSAFQMTKAIPVEYTLKMYDRTTSAFQLNKKRTIDPDQHQNLNSIILHAIQDTNDRAKDVYDQKMRKGEDMYLLRNVNYLYTANNGIHIEYNYKSGKVLYRFNIFKITCSRRRSLIKSSATPIGEWQ